MFRRAVGAAFLLCALTATTQAVEIVGPFIIVDQPISATEIVGGGGLWSGCNVVNAALSINDAFSGSPIIDDGYCNGEAGTTVEMTFGSPVVNIPGDDLVLLDARFSVNSYLFSTDFDGFAATIALSGASGIDTGVDMSYFYLSSGPFLADVIGHPIDLSALGVPALGSVSSVRFIGDSSEIDPLGVGVLPEPATLAPLALMLAAGIRRRR